METGEGSEQGVKEDAEGNGGEVSSEQDVQNGEYLNRFRMNFLMAS